MIKLLRLFLYLFKDLFQIPHILIYYFLDNGKIINKDIDSNCKISGCLLYKLCYLLISNLYFRNKFYHWIGHISYFIRWIFPAEKTFFINNMKLEGDIYVAHPYATIINAKSIGKNFSIRQCTTIGNRIDGRNDLMPTIGDNVNFCANVLINGNVTIGDNVIIGAGSIVVKDIPANLVAIVNPAIVIRSNC